MPSEKKYYKYTPKDDYKDYFLFEGSPWKTRKEWLRWLIKGFKSSWASHPIKEAKKSIKRLSNGLIPCRWCENEMTDTECSVIHIKDPLDLKDVDDVQAYFKRLFFVGLDDVQCVCKRCKRVVNYSWRNKMTYQQAECYVDAMDVEDSVSWLMEMGISPQSNKRLRQEQIAQKLMEQRCITKPSTDKKKS